MSRIEYRPSRPRSKQKGRGLLIFYRVLLGLVLLLGLIILSGTLYALAFRPKSSAISAAAPSSPAIATPQLDADVSIFTGLGRLRCPTAGSSAESNPGTVILQVAFPYYPGDRPFSEELVSRIREFRNISAAYFAALSAEELDRKGEEAVKAELLSRYNAVLRLGQIEVLYFNEYMLIE